jgi:hypothetical protein
VVPNFEYDRGQLKHFATKNGKFTFRCDFDNSAHIAAQLIAEVPRSPG